jgi:hypothetical protein
MIVCIENIRALDSLGIGIEGFILNRIFLWNSILILSCLRRNSRGYLCLFMFFKNFEY